MRADVILPTLALSMLLNAVAGVPVSPGVAGAALIRQSPIELPAVQVRPEFQSEINRLAAEGLKLKEAAGASLAPPIEHLAAIFERPNMKERGGAYEFRILESAGKTVKTLFTRKEFFFS